jgi:hypothetical protein
MGELLVLQCMYTYTHTEKNMAQDGERCGRESPSADAVAAFLADFATATISPAELLQTMEELRRGVTEDVGGVAEVAEGGAEGGDGGEDDSLPDLEEAEGGDEGPPAGVEYDYCTYQDYRGITSARAIVWRDAETGIMCRKFLFMAEVDAEGDAEGEDDSLPDFG